MTATSTEAAPSPATDAIVSPAQRAQSATRLRFEAGLTRLLTGRMEKASFGACRRTGHWLGLTFYRVGAKRRRLAIANVRLALGVGEREADEIARRASCNWGMTTCEFLHLPGATPEEIRDYVSLDGLEHLLDVMRDGGALVVTAHLGNWELFAARLAQEVPLSAIVRPISNPSAQAHMTYVRRCANYHPINKHAGARPALKLLREGGALYVLPDRHGGPYAALLPLFGRETRFETSTARVAALSGAPIVPVSAPRRAPWLSDGRIEGRIGRGFHVERDNPLDGTCRIMRELEVMVRRNPDQWSWMLRRWRDDDQNPVIHPPRAAKTPRP